MYLHKQEYSKSMIYINHIQNNINILELGGYKCGHIFPNVLI